jgi:hypothetical protein
MNTTPQLQTSAAMLVWQNELAQLIAAKVTADLQPEMQRQTQVLEAIRDIHTTQSDKVGDALDGLKRHFGI